MNFIFGTAGFAKEVDWLTEDIYAKGGLDYRADFFVAEDDNTLVGELINSREVISESEFFKISSKEKIVNCFVAVGKPEIKEKIVTKIKSRCMVCNFPNLIHPDVSFDARLNKVKLGAGNLIFPKSVLTTDILVMDFVLIYLGCTVGHESALGNFTTLSPGVHVSGNVQIGDKVFLGTGAVVLEKISICPNVIIGAGAVVTKDIVLSGTYVGVPVKKLNES